MRRAMVAAGLSKVRAVLDGMHLDPDEAMRVMLRLAIEHAVTAGIDRRGMLAFLDDMLAAGTVEGLNDGGDE